jgi:hypothetical protein
MRGVLFDLPHAIAAAAPQLERVGVAGRCELVRGSFFEAARQGRRLPSQDVLHDWDDERSVTILGLAGGRCESSAGARLFVIERLAAGRFGATARDRAIARSDLNMLVSPTARAHRSRVPSDAVPRRARARAHARAGG